jgi:hypothetical protein
MAKSHNIRALLRKYFLALFVVSGSTFVSAQTADTTFYLVTCGQGTETYSYYGHSALRLTIGKSDTVYNWGIFAFDTPFFVWKFAQGRLNYYLAGERFEGFLQDYFLEKRYVISQKINLNSSEKKELLNLVSVNLRPENVKYRYDFFYDNCSTRIRDLLEKTLKGNLIYPKSDIPELPTFRDKITEYQKQYAWYQFGTDMLLGSPTDKKAGFRDQMFLPIDLMNGLSASRISRAGVEIPLLEKPSVILDFPAPSYHLQFWLTPLFVFSLLLVIILLITSVLQAKVVFDIMDIFIFSVYSLLAILMIFFNFITDHAQTKWNFNIIWLSPFVIICLLYIVLGHAGKIWFRIVFALTAAFLICQFFLPQEFNLAIYPMVLILLVRSSARAGFSWNPVSVK